MPIAESLFGWYVGLTVAFVVVVVVVMLVASILTLTERIAQQARLATAGLDAVVENTSLIPAVDAVNASALAILKACRTARSALGDADGVEGPAVVDAGKDLVLEQGQEPGGGPDPRVPASTDTSTTIDLTSGR